MKERRLYFIIFLIIVIISLGCWFAFEKYSQKDATEDFSNDNENSTFKIIDTASNVTQAIQIANDKNKSVFVVFESDTCSYCVQLRQNTLNNPEVMDKLNESYVVTIVNINDNPEIANKYNVYATPTMVILDGNGNEIKSIQGYYGPEELLKMI